MPPPMHLATYGKGDAGAMLAHYERSIGERDHIDRDGVVYNLAPEFEGGCHGRFRSLLEGLDIDAKSRPLADFVVTAPKGFSGDTEAFFKACYEFLRGKVGEGRVVAAYVHLDEPGAEPHMHFAFVPSVETPVMTNDKSRPLRWTAKDERKNPEHKAGEIKKDSKGTVRYERVPLVGDDGKPVVRRTATASKLFTKKDMAELHPEIERHLCAALGMRRVGMTLDESDREQRSRKKLSALDHEDYVAVTAEIERSKAERDALAVEVAESKRESMELTAAIAEKEGDLYEVQSAVEDETLRLESLRQEGDRAAGRVEELESVVAAVRGFDHAGRSERRSVLREIARACDGLRARVEAVCGRLRALAGHVRAHVDAPKADAGEKRVTLAGEVGAMREASAVMGAASRPRVERWNHDR